MVWVCWLSGKANLQLDEPAINDRGSEWRETMRLNRHILSSLSSLTFSAIHEQSKLTVIIKKTFGRLEDTQRLGRIHWLALASEKDAPKNTDTNTETSSSIKRLGRERTLSWIVNKSISMNILGHTPQEHSIFCLIKSWVIRDKELIKNKCFACQLKKLEKVHSKVMTLCVRTRTHSMKMSKHSMKKVDTHWRDCVLHSREFKFESIPVERAV